MLYYCNSKVFQNLLLRYESYQDILDCQYVLVSTRIYTSQSMKNIINVRNILYPNAEVCMAMDDETFRDRYEKQLSENNTFFASIIKASIEEKLNIVFLNTYKEEKNLKYLKYLSEYLYIHFGYPCYEYKHFSMGLSSLLKYNKKEVLKLCNEYLRDAKDNMDIEKLPKKELIKRLKKEKMYKKGMNKFDMISLLGML